MIRWKNLVRLASPLIASTLIVTFGATTSYAQKHSYIPPNGFVPDEVTAIAIAIAVWNPIYGKEIIKKEVPYHATLKDGIWTVEGSLPKPPKGMLAAGGVAIAEISKDNGRILRVSHGE